MKFSPVLLLSPLVSLALAVPTPQDTGMDMECVQKYCVPMSEGITTCAKDNGVDMTGQNPSSVVDNKEYLDCICTKGGAVRDSYDSCLTCFTDDTLKEQYSGMLESVCNGETVDIPDTTDSDSGSDSGSDSDSDSDSSSDSGSDTSSDTDNDSGSDGKTDTTTTSDSKTETKKNAASSGKSYSLTMAGAMVVAGGIIAAM